MPTYYALDGIEFYLDEDPRNGFQAFEYRCSYWPAISANTRIFFKNECCFHRWIIKSNQRWKNKFVFQAIS